MLLRGGTFLHALKKEQGRAVHGMHHFGTFVRNMLSIIWGDDWCISPEQSLTLLSGNETIPQQLIIRSPKANNNIIHLLHNTSILFICSQIPEKRNMHGQIYTYSLEDALISCSPQYYKTHSIEILSILASIQDIGSIARTFLNGGHVNTASRVAGALAYIHRSDASDEIIRAMHSADYKAHRVNPFEEDVPKIGKVLPIPAHSQRLRFLWDELRSEIISEYGDDNISSKPMNKSVFEKIETLYSQDAYHSLSIEGYQVTIGLIERVKSGQWNPVEEGNDGTHANALAARGYWQAFQKVKASLEAFSKEKNIIDIIRSEHSTWYRELFSPSVRAGIISAGDLAGYRNTQVYIRGSMHIPPKSHMVLDLMETFFDLLLEEENILARIVLGHYFFVYIHPYIDGNGRIGRFLMNVIAVSSGYEWIVVPTERRSEYMDALEKVASDKTILPFADFISSLLSKR